MPIIHITPRSPEWHEYRRPRIGASEISALFDENRFTSAFALHFEKGGKVEPEGESIDNPNIRMGRATEAQIGIEAGLKMGWNVKPFEGIIQHDRINEMFATPDFEILNHPTKSGKGLLEVKNIGKTRYYETFFNSEPDHSHILQNAAQLTCGHHLGYTYGAIAAWCMGEFLIVKEYDFRPRTAEILEAAVVKFFDDIKNGISPQPDASERTWKIIKELYPTDPRLEIDLSTNEDFYQFCVRFEDAKKMFDEYSTIVDECKAKIKNAAEKNGCIKCREYLITIDRRNAIKIINTNK